MSRLLAPLGVLVCLSIAFADAPPSRPGLVKGDFLNICGDSITEQKLYSRFMEEYLLMCKPQPDLRIMQCGWNGECSWGFLAKMPNEAMRFDPTVVTVCFGMNDGGYVEPGTTPNYPRYRQSLRGIVDNFKKDGARLIVLASPGVVDTQTFWGGPERAARYNPVLANLRDIVREVAAEKGVVFANIHDPMLDVMARVKAKYGKKFALAGEEDGVHPDENGHMVMAYCLLKALGCDGNIGTITVDLSTGRAQATDGHTVLASHSGKVEIQSTRYPFCFFGDPASPRSTRGILEFIPFNEELNRFNLVVKGVTGRKVNVRWGDVSRQFEGDRLEKGINLAAEFLDNPFCEPFKRVEAAIKAQQDYETPLVKRLLHELASLELLVPEERAKIEAIKEAGQRRAREYFDKAATQVQPVKHTITLEVINGN